MRAGLTVVFALVAGCASAPQPAALRGGTIPRAHVEDRAYEVTLRPPDAPLRANVPARFVVEIATRSGFHLNDDYPIHFTPAPARHVTHRRARVDKEHGITTTPCGAEPTHACAATIPFEVVASRTPVTVAGEVAFSACDAEQCLIEKIDVTTLVSVAP